jgi:large subunit ribosomal protein L21
MFAIVQTGGKQYKIEKGQTLDVEKLDAEEGKTVNLEKVLLISDKTATKIGTPLVDGAYAVAKIVSQKRGDKVVVFKKKAKKRYQKTQGHRQSLTTIEITDIKASGGKKPAAVKKEEAVEKKPVEKKEEKAEVKES